MIHKRYECDFCHKEVNPALPPATGEGVRLYFHTRETIQFRHLRDEEASEHILCRKCAEGIAAACRCFYK